MSTCSQRVKTCQESRASAPLFEPLPQAAILSPLHVPHLSGKSSLSLSPRAAQESERPLARLRVDGGLDSQEDPHPTWRVAFERGKRIHGGVNITYQEFAEHIGELARGEAPGHATDLYLAAACGLGHPAALKGLDKHVESTRPVVARIARGTWVVDDILQDVRCRLLVRPASKLASYKGAGPLGSWVRTVAVNIARDHVRAESVRRGRESSQPVSVLPDHPPDPERDVAACITHRGRVLTCIEAVRLAFESLDTAERQLLRDYFLSNQSIDALGPRYLVNRATIARRIHRATDKVRNHLRKFLTTAYTREHPKMLDSMALTVCRDVLDTTELLASPHVRS